MKRYMKMIEGLTIAAALAIPLAAVPAVAQSPTRIDPPPEEPRMQGMMQMMREMHGDMHRMHGDMPKDAPGMGPMRERMGGMMMRMQHMTEMMERHHKEGAGHCPMMAPKTGG